MGTIWYQMYDIITYSSCVLDWYKIYFCSSVGTIGCYRIWGSGLPTTR